MDRHSTCPKCGSDAPPPGSTYRGPYGPTRSVTWVAARSAETTTKRQICRCQHKTWLGKLRGSKNCEQCKGVGWYDVVEMVSYAPEHIRIHCDGCGYSWREPPLDGSPEEEK